MLILLDIINILLTVVWWIIIIQIVLSWLIAFNVINTHNQFVDQLHESLNRITEPLYRPIRKILPDFGMLDLAPMIVLLIVIILQSSIIPRLYVEFM
jgi:YggT family protein